MNNKDITQLTHADDFVPCDQFIPPDDPEWKGYHHYSVDVLAVTKWGDYTIAHTYQYESDNRLEWRDSGSEGWDLTGDLLCWKSLPPLPDCITGGDA